VHVTGASGGGPHALALAANHPERVQATTVTVGLAPLEESDVEGMIEHNRKGWYAAHESWDALYDFLAPVREEFLADPLAAFRAVMDQAPARDKAVINDPTWQRVFIEDVTEAFRPGAEGWVDEVMAVSLPWDFDPSDVQCSVTWWHAEHDANNPIAAVRRLGARMNDVDLRVWTEAGHLEPYHRHDEIIGELLAH
jgi:pimeloyl-ACP methyl ester carboxylesterase